MFCGPTMPERYGRESLEVAFLKIHHEAGRDFQMSRHGEGFSVVIAPMPAAFAHIAIAVVAIEGLFSDGSVSFPIRAPWEFWPDQLASGGVKIPVLTGVEVSPVGEEGAKKPADFPAFRLLKVYHDKNLLRIGDKDTTESGLDVL